MDYYEAANFLFDLRRFQVDPGTESVRDLLDHLGDPHDGIQFVQIAGSNGKGSVARMTESVLRATDRRVGLFTSPHLEDLRERIRVDGRKIPEGEVTAFVEQVRPWLTERAADGEPLTFFEVVTALALWRFDRADVDVAVLEVGMGGELDATSVVDPAAAAVTNVELEHTSVLGDTVAEIARTKAAVAPTDRPLVTAATGEALATIQDETEEVLRVGPDSGTDVTTAYGGRVSHQESAVELTGSGWDLQARLPLLGAYQADNAGVAVALVRQLGVTDTDAIRRGLRTAHWPGRFEVMETDPLVVLDGAHNPGACRSVADTLGEFEYEDLHLVFGAMHDKDHAAMAAAFPEPATVRTCAAGVNRAEDADVLATVFRRAHPEAEVGARPTVTDALRQARNRASSGDCVLLTGSLYCVAEARVDWTREYVPKEVESLSRARTVLADANVPEDAIDRLHHDTVHEVLKTRASGDQAAYLKQEMAAIGGECATSGHRDDGELHEVVLMGTLAQFRQLVGTLKSRPVGLAGVGAALERYFEFDGGREQPQYPWTDRTAVMGVLNVTPDSFHDGGEYYDLEDAVDQARRLVEAGVDIIDVGGESTRPGAEPVPADEEIDRVVPVIESLREVVEEPLISVDTRKARVAEAALDAGADILNDVTGLEDPEMRFLAADRDVPVIIMHSIEAPVDPDNDVAYDDVVEDVIDELGERLLLAEKAGIPRENIIVDPGIGFGKTSQESFDLLGRLGEFQALGCPILVGHSHKSLFELVGGEAGDAFPETVAATAVAATKGADIVRVHDAHANVQAVRVAEAMDPGRNGNPDG